MSEDVNASTIDTRPPALGAARVLMGILVIFAAWSTIAAGSRLVDQASVGNALDVITGLVWCLVAAGIIHNGRRMRALAVTGLLLHAVGLVVAAAAETAEADWVREWLIWRGGGAHYWWIPAILLVVAAWWMIVSDPRRLAGR
ncbi:hypothetical protein H8R18_03705 [Nanchangia anserum]|uniref:Uncharacterized protein n=1 Tax=Nanchangia anserum TaxID=2692125 RepID=A0A8I0GAG6_9ACTO|nr:hypothetical protein [Nanchangia anserum]MBD3688666.1 hypothetical protein [Nanchangia anserum]QOX82421.1 hypothetical protein H8R18_03705 [Nanchangia anserum]